MTISLNKINEDYWNITVEQAVLGSITRHGSGWFQNKPPYTYEYRSTFTVDRQGRRVFGSRKPSLEEAFMSSKDHLRIIADSINESIPTK